VRAFSSFHSDVAAAHRFLVPDLAKNPAFFFFFPALDIFSVCNPRLLSSTPVKPLNVLLYFSSFLPFLPRFICLGTFGWLSPPFSVFPQGVGAFTLPPFLIPFFFSRFLLVGGGKLRVFPPSPPLTPWFVVVYLPFPFWRRFFSRRCCV